MSDNLLTDEKETRRSSDENTIEHVINEEVLKKMINDNCA